MAQDPRAELRAKLSFEQQSRFDAQYDRQSKKQGPATVLSMPLLGTFGLEQFYLGNVGSGIIRIIFSWTFIPTVLALFEILSGDLKKQVAHANARVAKRVYDQVLKNSPSLESVPPSVLDSVITPSAVAEAAAFAAEVPIAPVMSDPGALALPFSPTDVANDAATAEPTTTVAEVATVEEIAPVTAAPAAEAAAPAAEAAAPAVVETTEIDTQDHQEDVATTTTGAFTVTESAAAWQQGMDAPVVASDEQTYTVGSATDTVTDSGPTTTEVVTEATTPAPAAQPDSDAEPLLADTPPAADATAAPLDEEGVLVFVAEDEPLATDTVMSATVATPDETETETVAQHVEQQQVADVATIAEAEHVEAQHYHNGKLVAASRHDIKLTGEVNSLLTDTTTDTLLQEVESHSVHAPGWLDVSPLQSDDASAATVPLAADTTTAAPAGSDVASATTDAVPTTTDAAPTTTDATPATTDAAPTTTDATPTDGAAPAAPSTPVDAHVEIPVRSPDGGAVDGASGTDVPGGDLGSPPTNIPGGAVGDPGPATGTDVPSGGISSPTPDGGDTGTGDATPTGDGQPERHPKDGPIPS